MIAKSSLFYNQWYIQFLHIKGGNVEQSIDSIYLTLFTTYERESGDSKVTTQADIGRYQLTNSFTIQPNEVKEIPFSFMLPLDTPVTIGKTNVWVQTGLDIKSAVDPSDRDYISISPSPLAGAFLNTLTRLGFQLRNAHCEQAKGVFRNRLPFIQEFEFVPVNGPFRQKLDELEIVFLPIQNDLKVIIEVDRKARGFSGFLSEAMDMDETLISMTISERDIPNLPQIIESSISRYC
ncbi:Sporulation-control protein spo0M [compost metagenome]